MKVVIVTQARIGSTRFPKKVVQQIGQTSLLALHIKRASRSRYGKNFIVATTNEVGAEHLCQIARDTNVQSYRGSLDDVLDRFYQACKPVAPTLVVRLTSDCPLIDPVLIDKVVDHTISRDLDYCSNTLLTTYPDGQDVEVFKFGALERAWRDAKLQSEREHVTSYIWKNSSFKSGQLFLSENFSEGYNYGHLRMTVDEPVDLEVLRSLVEQLGEDCDWLTYAKYLDEHVDLKNRNLSIQRNEGYLKSIKNEPPVR